MQVINLGPGEGRPYAMGRLNATFKADEAETAAGYAVSEWHMQPGFAGVGAHAHAANDEMFYVLQGTCEFLLGADWTKAKAGTFIRIPAGVTHDFRNLGPADASVLNVYIPGGFERDMPQIVAWFAQNGGA